MGESERTEKSLVGHGRCPQKPGPTSHTAGTCWSPSQSTAVEAGPSTAQTEGESHLSWSLPHLPRTPVKATPCVHHV